MTRTLSQKLCITAKPSPRTLLSPGGKQRLHGFFDIRDAAAAVAHLDLHGAVRVDYSRYVHGADGIAVAVDDGVRHGFADGGL